MKTINNIRLANIPTFEAGHELGLLGIGKQLDRCSNCGGAGVVVITSILSQKTTHRPMTGGGKVAIPDQDGGWYIGESHTVPCIMCNGDRGELVNMLLDSCGVPMGDRTKSFNYYDGMSGRELMVETLQEFMLSFPECRGMITLFGPHDMGKTTAAQIVVMNACRHGVHAVYKTSRQLVMEIKKTWGDRESSEIDYLNDSVLRPRLLVIDEIDRITGNDVQYIIDAINTRYDHDDKATILITTSNLANAGGDGYVFARMKHGLRIPVT